METQIIFTLKDLMYLSASIAFIVLVVYLVLLLKEVIVSVKTLRKIIDNRQEQIEQIITNTPPIMENVDKITGVIAKGAEGTANMVEKIKQKKENKNKEDL